MADWANFLREIYIDWWEKSVKTAIRGVGAAVEVDETKIVRRKNNCGRIIEGQWVFGSIDR